MINNRNLDDFGGKLVAERVGFEPTVPCDTPHFECGALDHYATSPDANKGRMTLCDGLLWPGDALSRQRRLRVEVQNAMGAGDFTAFHPIQSGLFWA